MQHANLDPPEALGAPVDANGAVGERVREAVLRQRAERRDGLGLGDLGHDDIVAEHADVEVLRADEQLRRGGEALRGTLFAANGTDCSVAFIKHALVCTACTVAELGRHLWTTWRTHQPHCVV